MDSKSFADNTTVVGGPLSTLGDSSYLQSLKKPTANGKSTANDGPSGASFQTAEYMNTERPFFVTIGKDGLIAALQKLDLELRNVSSLLRASIGRLLSLTPTLKVWQNIYSITQETNRLDWEGDNARTTWLDQPWRAAQDPYTPRPIPRVSPSELVGQRVVWDERM
ncbi:hypothetical protein PHLCEN_2v657 [Hermanssonia centrifuga]|uniref:Uncharacterized protein n=1 Tax=Hermanssonia centrifuga TaxID=98765 RepID=A0A2R6S577_9APHY|nr:hypothetical protein PHLCEN_2v657 [Hermanssonia centrifuga]